VAGKDREGKKVNMEQAQPAPAEKPKQKGKVFAPYNFKVFDVYDISQVSVTDPGLKSVINLNEKLVLKTHGRHTEKYGRTKINVIERMIGYIGVPGHRGKKHKIRTNWASGKYEKNAATLMEAFKIIEGKTKQNPIQLLIKAIENSAPDDEVTTIEYGGARYPQAVDVSPLRRLNLALRNIVHGSYDRAFGKRASIAEGLAAEIISASQGNNESVGVTKKNESEKQADSAR
jgi:small subunit ribosomal protein S7